jgi:hypothetical protein
MFNKDSLKKIGSIVVPILILGVAGTFIYQLLHNPLKQYNNVANIISLDSKPSDTTRDDKGQLHARKQIVYIPSYSLADAMYKGIIDSLRKEIKLRDDAKIASLGTVTTITRTEFIPILSGDSIKRVFTFKTKWADLKVYQDTNKKSSIEYKDSLIFATIKQPYGFLKLKERQFINVRSANPDVKHIGVNYYEVNPPKNNKSKWGIGIGVGPGLSINKDNNGSKVIPSWVTANFGIQYRF